tara:strand:- start:384 stop:608 length:225 start_codon:yes stop_codon:yes gene_type:complete
MMNIPIKNNYDNDEKYKLAVDKFFYAKYGFREWITRTIDERVECVEKLGRCPVLYEEEDNRCMTFRRYEKGGLK